MPTDAEVRKIFRLLKKYLWPKALQWWKKRQQQQNGQGGSYASQSGPQQGNFGGQSGYDHQGGNYGPNTSYGTQQQSSYGGQQGSYGPQGSYAHPQAAYGGSAHSSQMQGQPHKPSLIPGNTDHFGQHAGHVNQDMINASNEQYVSLRNQAIREGDLMHQAFDQASKAHDRGDGAAAKQFSNEGHAHQKRKDELNEQASNWIFSTNNQQSPQGTVDLHGLYVQEAIRRTELAVQDAQRQGLPELRVITGKGLHSTQHVAKIKPAIEDLFQRYHLSAHVDPHNTGVLIVNLQGGRDGSRDVNLISPRRILGVEDAQMSFVDGLANQAEGDKCTIM